MRNRRLSGDMSNVPPGSLNSGFGVLLSLATDVDAHRRVAKMLRLTAGHDLVRRRQMQRIRRLM